MTVKTIKERPILFSAPMVKALLDGRKTQTRRVVKITPFKFAVEELTQDLLCEKAGIAHFGFEGVIANIIKCPYGQRGDRLWVRESFRFGRGYDGIKSSEVPKEDYVPVWYEADAPHSDVSVGAWVLGRYRPSIHMPRAFSRITLEITDIRVERLQDISEKDARAEGIPYDESIPQPAHAAYLKLENGDELTGWDSREVYIHLWEFINGKGSWDANPFVWVIGFEPVERHNVTP